MKIISINLKTFIFIILTGCALVAGAFLIDLFQGKSNGFGFFQIGAVCLGAFLIVFAGVDYSRKVQLYFDRALTFVVLGFFVLGIVLMFINISGLFISLRKPAVYKGIDFLGRVSIPKLSANEVAKVQDRRLDETVQEYAYRLTSLVNESTIQLADEKGKYPQFNLRVPIHENYIYWLFS